MRPAGVVYDLLANYNENFVHVFVLILINN